jgi:hypothetical protein
MARVGELFDKLATDLTSIRPDLGGKSILCPLCLRSFDRSALRIKTDDGLSPEHMIGRKLGGGRWVTLTCRKCNNRHGSALEAHLVHEIKVRDWSAGDGSTLMGTVSIEGVDLPMTISRGAGQEPWTISIFGGHPKVLADFQELAGSMRDGDRVQLRFSLEYNQSKSQRALLRVAYLVMFNQFGYAYALSEAGAFVRKVIEGAEAEHLWRFLPQLGTVDGGGFAEPVSISSFPDDEGVVIAHFVLIRLERKQKYYYAALIPAATLREDAVIPTLSAIGSKLDKKHCRILAVK